MITLQHPITQTDIARVRINQEMQPRLILRGSYAAIDLEHAILQEDNHSKVCWSSSCNAWFNLYLAQTRPTLARFIFKGIGKLQ